MPGRAGGISLHVASPLCEQFELPLCRRSLGSVRGGGLPPEQVSQVREAEMDSPHKDRPQNCLNVIHWSQPSQVRQDSKG